MSDTMHVCNGGHGCAGIDCCCPCHFDGDFAQDDEIEDAPCNDPDALCNVSSSDDFDWDLE